MSTGLVLVKLGGSVVTFKQRRLTPNHKAIVNICKMLEKIDRPIIIVHGGGSFGHYWSVRYDMHTRPKQYDPRGISTVHQSMVTLNEIIASIMKKYKLLPYTIMPNALAFKSKPCNERILDLRTIANRNIIPVTFGDVIHVRSGKFSILSGDVLMTMLARALRPMKVIFAVNVDGVYQNLKNGKLISEVDEIRFKSLELSKVKSDITGGMKRKVSEGLKMASLGINVMMVNGLKPRRIIDAITGSSFQGTLIKASSGSNYV
jgi:isopentenyl phosphate kinase